jgi:hypothetical protein
VTAFFLDGSELRQRVRLAIGRHGSLSFCLTWKVYEFVAQGCDPGADGGG